MKSDEITKKDWKNYFLIGGGTLLIVFIFFVVTGNNPFSKESITSPQVQGAAVAVETTLQNFQYNPSTLTVKKGSMITLTIINKDNVVHGLHLPRFGVQDSIPPLQTKVVQFQAIETSGNEVAMPTCSQEHGEKLTINVV